MKPFYSGILIILLALQAVGDCPAQTRPSASAAVDVSARYRPVMAQARTQAMSGDVASAEQTMATFIDRTQPDTAEWHRQCAFQLTRLAFDLVRKSPEPITRAVAVRALAHLQLAERLSSDAKVIASAREKSGLIFERILGDPVMALDCYERAVAANAADGMAQEGLRRMKQADTQRRLATKRG
jgi:hypothetical protein